MNNRDIVRVDSVENADDAESLRLINQGIIGEGGE
jgi:hypothetical protein